MLIHRLCKHNTSLSSVLQLHVAPWRILLDDCVQQTHVFEQMWFIFFCSMKIGKTLFKASIFLFTWIKNNRSVNGCLCLCGPVMTSAERLQPTTATHWAQKQAGVENRWMEACEKYAACKKVLKKPTTRSSYFCGLHSSLCARLRARAPLVLFFRCSSLFCWIRLSNWQIVTTHSVESFAPYTFRNIVKWKRERKNNSKFPFADQDITLLKSLHWL